MLKGKCRGKLQMTEKELISVLRKEVRKLLQKNSITVSREKFVTSVGRAWVEGRRDVIKIPPLTSLEKIAVAFHEIAHAIFEHSETTKKEHVQEYEAEIWTLKKLRKFNAHVILPSEYISIEKEARRNVYWCTLDDGVEVQSRIKKWLFRSK
jgi:hypothetical protein